MAEPEVSEEILLFEKIFFCIIAISGTFGNILLITAIVTNKKLRTVTNAFLINAAISDLIICGFFLPVSVPLLKGPPSNKAFCTFLGYVTVVCTGALSCNYFWIALTLYVPACKSNDLFRRIFKRRNIFLMCIGSWLLICVAFLPLFFGIGRWGYSKKFGMCVVSDDRETYWAVLGFVDLAILYPTMFFTMYFYFQLYKKYKKSLGQIENWDKEYHNASGSDLDEGEEKQKVKKSDQNWQKHGSVSTKATEGFRENEKRTEMAVESEEHLSDFEWDSDDEGSVKARDTQDSGTAEHARKADIETNQENTILKEVLEQEDLSKPRKKPKSSLKQTRKHTTISSHVDIEQLDHPETDAVANSNAPEEEVEAEDRKMSQWMSPKSKDADKVKRQGSWVKTHYILWVNFLTFWTPLIILYRADYNLSVHPNVYHLINCLAQSCCAVNYLILPLLNDKFRVAYKKLLTCDF